MTFNKLELWFDVGIKRYTTQGSSSEGTDELWFDVGIKRYTTPSVSDMNLAWLWFDVGIKRYTTYLMKVATLPGCGLM